MGEHYASTGFPTTWPSLRVIYFTYRRPLFIKIPHVKLEAIKTPNVVAKLEETIHRLDTTVEMRCVLNLASDSCNGMSNVRKTLQEKKCQMIV